MKKATSILLICTLCSSMISCAAAGKSSGEAAVEAGSEEAAGAAGSGESAAENSSEEIDYTTGTPWMCIDLEGNVTADTPTDLKDDYGLWANKDRILSLKIQEGLPTAGNNVDLALQANENKEAMFHGQVPQGHDARLAYDYYYLLTDWDSRSYADRYACQHKPALMDTLLADVHPLNYLRVNANLQQFDEFLNFYGITEGDNMYLAPEDRVAIW